MRHVIVTGGSGLAGHAVCRELASHGYEVTNLDRVAPAAPAGRFVSVDLRDAGETFDVMAGIDRGGGPAQAVVHLAAIPTSGTHPDQVVFHNNTTSTYNVFSAAAKLGIRRVAWASSETLLGLPFDRAPPAYVPLDEAAPLLPESHYSLSKALGEEMARQFVRWYPGMVFAGLRFSNIMAPEDYAGFAAFQDDPQIRKWNLWGYVDARDVAQACRLSLEAELDVADAFIIAAADTVMGTPNRELLAAAFPAVTPRADIGAHDTLLSIEKARRLLGYAPAHSWRD